MFKPTKKDLERPVTVGDFVEFADFIVENVAMKSDLARFATKDDLARFATKDDLARFATKDDLARFATKDDLVTFKDEILTGHDKIMKKLDIVLTEQAATNGNVDQYRDEVKGHEKRIGRLEAHAGI